MNHTWRWDAACADPYAGVNPVIFHPEGTQDERARQTVEAKKVCAGCPVAAECLTFAYASDSEGIAGGLTVDERRALNKRPRRQAADYDTCRCGRAKRRVSHRCAVCAKAYRRTGVVASRPV